MMVEPTGPAWPKPASASHARCSPFGIGLAAIEDAEKDQVDPDRVRRGETVVVEHVADDVDRAARLDFRADIAQRLARLVARQQGSGPSSSGVKNSSCMPASIASDG
jgi:hypothetical protein